MLAYNEAETIREHDTHFLLLGSRQKAELVLHVGCPCQQVLHPQCAEQCVLLCRSA